MGEIKFRGKKLENGEWIYGYYGKLEYPPTDKHYIMTSTINFNPNTNIYFTDWEVDPNTVGQYTGIKDKNGKEIYEGDIVKWTKREYTNCSREEIESEDVYIDVMKWHKTMYGIYTSEGKGYLLMPYYIEKDDFEVIGNIYENPNLI